MADKFNRDFLLGAIETVRHQPGTFLLSRVQWEYFVKTLPDIDPTSDQFISADKKVFILVDDSFDGGENGEKNDE